jgi:hypothetical protein
MGDDGFFAHGSFFWWERKHYFDSSAAGCT